MFLFLFGLLSRNQRHASHPNLAGILCPSLVVGTCEDNQVATADWAPIDETKRLFYCHESNKGALSP
jgi:hypothetical protein